MSTNPTEPDAGSEVRYFAGDWSELHKILPFASDNKEKLSGSFDGYDIVLMAETVYSLSTLKTLYKLITQVELIQMSISFCIIIIFDEMLYFYYFIASLCNVVLNTLIVLEPSSWSCILGWKKALLWSRRRNPALSLCVRKRR